ncbi:MAG: low specificity L-threonine aldolase [Candidatus Kapabacteria bacterium]|nr:low specificity L-threonine aldolase [Candidatus Kapabacteria bacterium]
MSQTLPFKSFASDNNAGAHPAVMEALQRANTAHALAYGGDALTEEAVKRIQSHFGDHSRMFFAFNGTGANVIALQAMTRSFHSILCSVSAHVNVDECGAPEKFTGCKLIAIPTQDAKLTPDLIAPHLHGFGVEHHSQPKVIALTQSSEYGTVYTPDEIRAITTLAKQHGMYVFMDGARLANAAAHLGLPLRAFTSDVGVDAVSFGGTKNGLMMGEAVVFCNPETASHLASDAPFLRKQSMQLCSKMRFIAAQFLALLDNDLWLHNAGHANQMAQKLAEGLGRFPQIRLTQPVQANAVFAVLPKEAIAPLQERHFFYVWNEALNEVRLMAAFDTTEEDIERFLASVGEVLERL